MDKGYFIAQRLPDGAPGRPIGNDDGAIMVFEELGKVAEVRASIGGACGELHIFQVNMVLIGEVVA